MKKLILLAALVSLPILNINAKGDGKPYHLNGPFDNLFVSAGTGIHGVVDNGFANLGNVSLEAAAGKWFTPSLGLRLGVQGFTNKAADSYGWFSGDQRFGYSYIHADIMWNLLNTFCGYNYRRVVSVSPYVHAGGILTSFNGVSNAELGSGLGLYTSIRLSGSLDAYLDIRANMAKEEAFRGNGKVVLFPSATMGVAFNFGARTHTFHRHEMELKTVIKMVEDDSRIKDLNAELAALRSAPRVDVAERVVKYLDEGMVTYFTIDTWTLTNREKYHLEDMLRYVPAGATLRITGHADEETGSHSRNDRLARERVKVVEAALRELGFRGRIVTDSKGDRENPFKGRAPKNRCVTIQVTLE